MKGRLKKSRHAPCFIAHFLLARHAKAIVIACNTATAAAAELLRARCPVPIVALEPGIKPAAALTQRGVVGVLATSGTLASIRFATLVERYGQTVTVVTQECPGLAAQVEAGDLSGPATRALVERYTAPLLAAGADTLVLGCTHYPFLRPLIAQVVGPGVQLVETGEAVARQLAHVLAQHQLLTSGPGPGVEWFWTSGAEDAAAPIIARLWGEPVAVQLLPSAPDELVLISR